MACGSFHPDLSGVVCIATAPTHADHVALHEGAPVFWVNEDFVAPAPKSRSKAAIVETLTEAARRVPPAQRRKVDADVIAIGADHPETSHKMAARKIGKTGTQRREIYRLALSRGDHGLTDDEAEAELGLLHQSASAARNSLMKDGWLIDAGIRRLTRSGEEAIAWVALPEENV